MLTLTEEQDVIEQVVHLGRRLQQRHQHCPLHRRKSIGIHLPHLLSRRGQRSKGQPCRVHSRPHNLPISPGHQDTGMR